jgi:hypothetical protein
LDIRKKEFGYYEDSNDRLIGRIARFFLVQHTQTGKIYQMSKKYMYKMSVKYVPRPNGHKIYQHRLLQEPSKFTQIGIFGLKIWHLATLLIARMTDS